MVDKAVRAGKEPESPMPTREWLIWAAGAVSASESKWDPEYGEFDPLASLLALLSSDLRRGDWQDVERAWLDR